MDRAKLVPIVLLIILLIIGFVGFQFYRDKSFLQERNKVLQEENSAINQENGDLKNKCEQAEGKLKVLESKLPAMEKDLEKLNREKDSLSKKYDEIIKERDGLVEKLKVRPTIELTRSTQDVGGTKEDYWTDFIKTKAELEAQLEILNRKLMEANTKMVDMDTQNKELSIKVDSLKKEGQRLTQVIAFKTRTIDIMSRDLVNERETKSKMSEDVNDLRKENVDLKREVMTVNQEIVKLQKDIKEAMEEKDILQGKMAEVEQLLKEKSLGLESVQKQLSLAKDVETANQQSAAVELPPIVVNPETSADLSGKLKGQIISVVKEDNFVVVDLGESTGIKAGVNLNVMRGDKKIGTVEVIETRKEVSAAEIKDIVSGFKLQEGDKVIK